MDAEPSAHEPTEAELRRARRWLVGTRVVIYGSLLAAAVSVLALRDRGDASAQAGRWSEGTTAGGQTLRLRIVGDEVHGFRASGMSMECDDDAPYPDVPALPIAVRQSTQPYKAVSQDRVVAPTGDVVDRYYDFTAQREGRAWTGTMSEDVSWTRDGEEIGHCEAFDAYTLPDE